MINLKCDNDNNDECYYHYFFGQGMSFSRREAKFYEKIFKEKKYLKYLCLILGFYCFNKFKKYVILTIKKLYNDPILSDSMGNMFFGNPFPIKFCYRIKKMWLSFIANNGNNCQILLNAASVCYGFDPEFSLECLAKAIPLAKDNSEDILEKYEMLLRTQNYSNEFDCEDDDLLKRKYSRKRGIKSRNQFKRNQKPLKEKFIKIDLYENIDVAAETEKMIKLNLPP